MTAEAHIEHDWMNDGVRIAARLNPQQVLQWGEVSVTTVDPMTAPARESWLELPTDVARALYEALADHFGHSGHDTRALRKDYEAERARVDRLIDAAIKGRS